jgi:hypothetical protein
MKTKVAHYCLSALMLVLAAGCAAPRVKIGFPSAMRTLAALFASMLLASFLTACNDAGNTSSGEPCKDASSATGYYMPVDLEDALTELDRIMGTKGRDEILKTTEQDMFEYHHGVGTWMRNNWGLRKGSQLAKYFNQLGIHHPDDMSGIILSSYWRRTHGKPIDLEGQVRRYQQFWAEKKAMKSTEPSSPAEPSEPESPGTDSTALPVGSDH